MVTVVICSYFEEEHVERIRAVDGRLRVLYREDLVPPPRWPGDHVGPPEWRRSEEDEKELLAMLGEAKVLYDFPRGHVRDLIRVAPRLRWVQASMAGAGEVAQKAGLQDTDVVVTTASGVYSGPLAEFAMMALLQHVKNLDRLRRDKAAGARPFGMRVVGVKRAIRENDEAWGYADELYATRDLRSALRKADY